MNSKKTQMDNDKKPTAGADSVESASQGEKEAPNNETEELFRRWPIPYALLTEMIGLQEEAETVRARRDAEQEKLNILSSAIFRLQRAAALISGAPSNAELHDIYVGFTPAGTNIKLIAAIAPQCMENAAKHEKRELTRQWAEQ